MYVFHNLSPTVVLPQRVKCYGHPLRVSHCRFVLCSDTCCKPSRLNMHMLHGFWVGSCTRGIESEKAIHDGPNCRSMLSEHVILHSNGSSSIIQWCDFQIACVEYFYSSTLLSDVADMGNQVRQHFLILKNNSNNEMPAFLHSLFLCGCLSFW